MEIEPCLQTQLDNALRIALVALAQQQGWKETIERVGEIARGQGEDVSLTVSLAFTMRLQAP